MESHGISNAQNIKEYEPWLVRACVFLLVRSLVRLFICLFVLFLIYLFF